MSARAWRLIGIACVAATLALEAMAGVLYSFTDEVSSGETPVDILVALPTFVLLASVGALILARVPGHRIGILFALAPVSMMLANVLGLYYDASREHDLPAVALLEAIGSPTWVVAAGSLAAFLPLLFPTGEYLTPRWRWVGRMAAACLIVISLTLVLAPGPVQDVEEVTNPIGIPGTRSVMQAVGGAAFIGLLVMILLGILSLVLRFLRARGVERQQMKWFVGATLVALGFSLGVGPIIEIAGVSIPDAAYLFVIALVPASVGLAILRYRLFDIDLIINRTLVYGLLTGTLGGGYFGGIILLQLLSRPVTGGSGLAVAATTLLVAALFRPARSRIQDAVDRRFNRRKYDAAKTIEAFSARLRQQTDLDTLTEELLAVVRETMEPARVSLWLRARAGAGPGMGASTRTAVPAVEGAG